ncbi:MAG TPA: hypothetical protein VKF38_03140 [Anaerolineaceae bacterium]|nr:hypothetical protein [Anaerolineaceae bacterium]
MRKQPAVRMNPIRQGLGVAVLLLVLLACNLPLAGATQTAQPQSVQTPIPLPTTNVPTETAQPTATALPVDTAQPTSLPPTATSDLLSTQFGGVSFSYDPSLASKVVGKTVAAVNAQNGAPWEIAPQSIQFDFTDYLLPGSFNQPALIIYPVDGYKSVNAAVAPIINDLQSLLKTTPSNPAQALPFLPTWNAAQIMHSNVFYLKFKNGAGVRYLAEYGQAIFPINNHMLFYTFQGITQNGKYYISLVLPVNNSILPADEKIPQSDYGTFSANFDNYLKDIQAKLDAQPPSSFKPDLSGLDALVQSLSVQ